MAATDMTSSIADLPILEQAGWYRALATEQRLRSLRSAGDGVPGPQAPFAPGTNERLARWLDDVSLKNSGPLVDPWVRYGCSKAEFLAVLGEDIEEVRQRTAHPLWVRELEDAFTSFAAADILGDQPAVGMEFMRVLEPPIAAAKDRLRDRAATIKRDAPWAPFDAGTIAELQFKHVQPRLSRLLVRTLVLELHAKRLDGRLVGATSQERFRSFTALLLDRAFGLRVLRDYPVLARLAMTVLADWIEFCVESLARLADDWPLLTDALALSPSEVLTSASSLGDRHRGGRSVLALTFESGAIVIYKPRPVSVEVHFQDLLRWLTNKPGLPPFRTFDVIDRGEYGWVEHVEASPCVSHAELRAFYERHGAYLALLYVLGASDFHFENVIAAGEHPVLVDLECLFHAHYPRAFETLSGAERLVADAIHQSVLNIGLLPRPELTSDESRTTDLSGLGATPGQLSPVRISQWEDEGTDAMRQVLRGVEISGMQHSPHGDQVETVLADFREDVLRGFVEAYRALWSGRDQLLDDDGPIVAFAHDKTRCVLRGTLDYTQLLETSLHPYFLRDALDLDRRYDRLIAAEQSWTKSEIASAERHDLWRGDVPFFGTRVDSRDVWTSSGERIANFLPVTGLELAQRRLADLSEADLERQRWMVNFSLASAGITSHTTEYPDFDRATGATRADGERLRAAAHEIGERLESLAFRTDDEATWIGIRADRVGGYRIEPATFELFGGLTGIALFLAYLSRIEGGERWTALARAALPPARRQVERGAQEKTLSCGAFDGLGGVIYALSHLGTLWNDDELRREVEALIDLAAGTITPDASTDIISGTAGFLAVLLAVSDYVAPKDVLTPATLAGEHLLESALEMEHGIAWPAPRPDWRPLGGFAHGTAGIAWSLLELSARTGDRRFHDAGRAAIEHQRSLFAPEVGNWRDLRRFEGEGEDEERFMSHWCHGAAGIALALIACGRHADLHFRDEIETGLRTASEGGFGYSHCLCHGDLGNADVLLTAANEGIAVTDLDEVAGEILASIEKRGWLTGFPIGLEGPGLMMGLAGIGYGLLRLAVPQHVPSVLLLEPPRATT